MAFRIETRAEMLFRYAGDEEDYQQAQRKIVEIMQRNRIRQSSPAIQQSMEAGLRQLADAEPSSWKFFDWFVSNMLRLLQGFENMMENNNEIRQQLNALGPLDPNNPPPNEQLPQTLLEVNAQAENLMTLTEEAATINKTMPANIPRPAFGNMDTQQMGQWVQENSRYLTSAKWEEFNPVYTYENGWQVLRLTSDKDYMRAGKELANCVRYAPDLGWKGHKGIFVIVDENETPRVALRMGTRDETSMDICYDAKAKIQGKQADALPYADFITQFLNETSPQQMYGEDYSLYDYGDKWRASPELRQWMPEISARRILAFCPNINYNK